MRIRGVPRRISLWLCVFVLTAFPLLNSLFRADTVHAAQITARSLTLQKNGSVTTGGSAPNADANHRFNFTVTTTAGINSISFEYCDTATGTCNAPAALDVTTGGGTTLGSNTNLGGSPSYVSTAANRGYVTFTAPLAGAAVMVTLNAVNNPSAENTTFFARIVTYTSADATTGSTDTGVVAASTTRTILVTGIMPEYLLFCTGGTVDVTCSTIGSGSISFNSEFSPLATRTTTSQMAAGTNAGTGYAIVATGTTLTSGANTIATAGATAVDATTTIGTSVWGINLIDNTTPNVGADINPASNGGSNLYGDPTAQYAIDGDFALDIATPDTIANTDFSTPGTQHATLAQVYTVSYFANVSGVQPAGTYVATLNYVCTPTF